jgi:DNA sulfur modification protein DndC
VIGESDMALLSELCGPDRLHYELTRELIDVERRHRNIVRRSTIFNDIEKAFRRGFYENESEATVKVRKEQELLQRARDIRENALTPIDGAKGMIIEKVTLQNVGPSMAARTPLNLCPDSASKRLSCSAD